MKRIALSLAAPFLAALLILSGCDSGDPVDRPDPRDVAGRYNFTEFRFDPEGPGFADINVLDTLDAGGTDLRLSSDGTFILSIEFVNGSPFFLSGDFSVSNTTIEFEGRENQSSTYTQILLTQSFVLRRDLDDDDVLTASITKNIDPSAFSNRYRGVNSMNGTLHLRLEQQ